MAYFGLVNTYGCWIFYTHSCYMEENYIIYFFYSFFVHTCNNSSKVLSFSIWGKISLLKLWLSFYLARNALTKWFVLFFVFFFFQRYKHNNFGCGGVFALLSIQCVLGTGLILAIHSKPGDIKAVCLNQWLQWIYTQLPMSAPSVKLALHIHKALHWPTFSLFNFYIALLGLFYLKKKLEFYWKKHEPL